MESNEKAETVVVPRWALEFILENASLCDEGVSSEGWRSRKMQEAQETIEIALKEAS